MGKVEKKCVVNRKGLFTVIKILFGLSVQCLSWSLYFDNLTAAIIKVSVFKPKL